jgi:hypothetical protein
VEVAESGGGGGASCGGSGGGDGGRGSESDGGGGGGGLSPPAPLTTELAPLPLPPPTIPLPPPPCTEPEGDRRAPSGEGPKSSSSPASSGGRGGLEEFWGFFFFQEEEEAMLSDDGIFASETTPSRDAEGLVPTETRPLLLFDRVTTDKRRRTRPQEGDKRATPNWKERHFDGKSFAFAFSSYLASANAGGSMGALPQGRAHALSLSSAPARGRESGCWL